jgi:ATP-binding cassette subfamily B protein
MVQLLKINAATFGKLYAGFPEFRAKIEERIAAQYYKRTARLPLDFVQEIHARQCRSEPNRSSAGTSGRARNRPTGSGRLPRRTAILSKGSKRIRKLNTFKQVDEMDCGAASLAMICRHFGRNVSLAASAKWSTRRQTAPACAVCATALSAGAGPRARSKRRKNNVTQMPLPAIIHWDNYHWVVLFECERHTRLDRRSRDCNPQNHTQGTGREVERLCRALRLHPKLLSKRRKQAGPGVDAPFLKPFTAIFAKALGLAAVISALQMLLPVFTQVIVDSVVVERDSGMLTMMVGAMMVGAGLFDGGHAGAAYICSASSRCGLILRA